MTARFDIAIIGGGVIGLTLARRLATSVSSLAVIDGSAATPPATLAAAGMLAPSFEEGVYGEALYAFSAASLALWPAFAAELEAETGVDVDFRNDGVLGVAFSEGEAVALEKKCADLAARGASVRILTGDAARAAEPALSSGVVAAMEAAEDAQVDPAKLTRALHAAIVARGGVVVSDIVQEVAAPNDGWLLRLANGDAIKAGQVVMAVGAAKHWPLADPPRAPVFPVKGEAFSVAAAPSLSLVRVIRTRGAYLCPKAGGRVVIGATEEARRDDLTVSPDAVAGLRAAAVRAAPAVADCAEIARWAGLRPATPDGAPILGRAPSWPRRLWAALGHYRNGVLLAPASAESLAAEILGETPDFDLSAFLPDRFG